MSAMMIRRWDCEKSILDDRTVYGVYWSYIVLCAGTHGEAEKLGNPCQNRPIRS